METTTQSPVYIRFIRTGNSETDKNGNPIRLVQFATEIANIQAMAAINILAPDIARGTTTKTSISSMRISALEMYGLPSEYEYLQDSANPQGINFSKIVKKHFNNPEANVCIVAIRSHFANPTYDRQEPVINPTSGQPYLVDGKLVYEHSFLLPNNLVSTSRQVKFEDVVTSSDKEMLNIKTALKNAFNGWLTSPKSAGKATLELEQAFKMLNTVVPTPAEATTPVVPTKEKVQATEIASA